MTLKFYSFFFKLAVEESLPVTPFSLLLGKHRRQQAQGDIELGKPVVHDKQEPASPAVKEVGVITVNEQAKSRQTKSFIKLLFYLCSFCTLQHTFCHLLPSSALYLLTHCSSPKRTKGKKSSRALLSCRSCFELCTSLFKVEKQFSNTLYLCSKLVECLSVAVVWLFSVLALMLLLFLLGFA